jgi:hypothetical protein
MRSGTWRACRRRRCRRARTNRNGCRKPLDHPPLESPSCPDRQHAATPRPFSASAMCLRPHSDLTC